MSYSWLRDIDRLSPEQLFYHVSRLDSVEIQNLCATYPRINQVLCQPDSAFNIWAYLYYRDITARPLPEGTDYQQEYLRILSITEGQEYRVILRYASSMGYEKLVQQTIDSFRIRGQNHRDDYNEILTSGAGGGHMEIVRLAIHIGANDFDSALITAAIDGRTDVMELMMKYSAADYDHAAFTAALGNSPAAVRLMLWKGARNYNHILRSAAGSGSFEIVNWMLSLGANDYNSAMIAAAFGGHLGMVEYMLSLGGDIKFDYDSALYNAVSADSVDIAELMLQLGANPYQNPARYMEMLAMANENRNGNPELRQLLEEWPQNKIRLG